MKRPAFVLTLVSLLALSCARTHKRAPKVEDVNDFSLGKDPDEEAVAPKPLLAAPEVDPNDDSFSHSSLPLAMRVGHPHASFDKPPKQAEPPLPAYQILTFGKCMLGIKTGTIEFDRFLFLGGRWIKLQGSLPANTPLRIELGMDLYLSFSTQPQVHLLKSKFQDCVAQYRGKRQYLGKFAMNKASISFIGAPGSPKKVFKKGKARAGVPIYLRWKNDDIYPKLEDADGLTASLVSPIFYAKMKENGYYYVGVRPSLELLPK